MAKTGSLEIEIYYEDTDCGGVVYYANYLRFFERARTQLFRSLGVDPAAWARDGVTFAVTHAEADYKGSARYGDVITVRTTVEPLRSVRLTFGYEIVRGEELLVTGRTDLACLNGQMRPRRIPEQIMERIVE